MTGMDWIIEIGEEGCEASNHNLPRHVNMCYAMDAADTTTAATTTTAAATTAAAATHGHRPDNHYGCRALADHLT